MKGVKAYMLAVADKQLLALDEDIPSAAATRTIAAPSHGEQVGSRGFWPGELRGAKRRP